MMRRTVILFSALVISIFQYTLIGSQVHHQIFADSVKGNSRWEPPDHQMNPPYDSVNSQSRISLIIISSHPEDAEVLADTILIGRTPAKIPYVSKLTLRKKGFAEKEIYPQLSSEMQNFELVRLASLHKESFFQSNTFTLVSAAIIVLGGTAAYLKIQADGQFEEYQKTGNDAFLSKTREYDLYSGLAFGVMQINFGYLVYKFLVNP